MIGDDIFDVFDDEADELALTETELDRYFIATQTNSMAKPMLMMDEEPVDDKALTEMDSIEMIPMTENEDDTMTEVVLSQKLSQLTTKQAEETTTTIKETLQALPAALAAATSKTFKRLNSMDEDGTHFDLTHDDPLLNPIENDPIPTYLLLRASLFNAFSKKIVTTTVTVNDIHDIAVIKHRIATLLIRQEITDAYLQSVIGKFNDFEYDFTDMDRRVWPVEVKSFMHTHHPQVITTSSTGDTVPEVLQWNMNDGSLQATCERILNDQLKARYEQIKQLKQTLTNKKSTLVGYSTNIDESLDSFVDEHGIQPLKMKRDFKLAMIKHNYESELLERQFIREKPNEYQMQTAKHLTERRRSLERSKCEVLALKQRLAYNKPLFTWLLEKETIVRPSTRYQYKTQVINKDDILTAYRTINDFQCRIEFAERRYYEQQMSFDQELAKMWENHRNLVKNQGMTTALIHLIEKRLENITRRWKYIYNYRVEYYIKHIYDRHRLASIEISEGETVKPLSVSSNIIITTKHSLTNKQLQLLNRGPSYVPLGQLYLSNTSSSPSKRNDTIVKAYYAPFKHQLTTLFAKYRINIALTMEIQKKAYELFKDLFSTPMPTSLEQRAIYEKQLIHSSRYSLSSDDIILQRTADNMNTFVLMSHENYRTRADHYLARSEEYRLLINSNEHQSNPQEELQNRFKDILDSMEIQLLALKSHKSIDNETFNRLKIDPTKIKLPHLFFLLDVSEDHDTALVPMIAAKDSATWKIGHYLDQLLRPFVTKILQPTTFRDEAEFMHKLNVYAHVDRRLQANTLFASLKIKNFYVMDTHQNVIDTVAYFLQDNLVDNRLENVTIMTIKNLLHMYLYNNIFCFDDHVWKMEKGSPQSIPLSETLSNIYLFIWQKKILKQLSDQNELFGRHKDEIFFTWNKSNNIGLQSFLQDIREKDKTVRYFMSTGFNVDFLSILIENRNGLLYTRVHHEPTIQQYRLPYVMGHSKFAHGDWLRSALIRAACCCTTVNDFHQEKTYIELTFLVNGYSVDFVDKHIQHFFEYFHVPAMRYATDSIMFNKFRQKWFDYMSMQHEHCAKLEQINQEGRLVNLNYFYEYGPRCQFNEKFYQLWAHYFKNHPSLSKHKLKLLLKPKHYQTLNSFLVPRKLDYLVH